MFNSFGVHEPVAVYARVSTDDQSERGTIASQTDFAQKYCEMYGMPIYKVYMDDGISGTVPFSDRPSGAELLRDAKDKKFSTVLVYKLDRLGRSTRIILNTIYDLEQLGVKLKSMTEPFDTGDASGRFLLTILAGVADLERSNILDRMQLGSDRAAKEGKWLGGIVPYGYRKGDDKYLHINEDIIPSIGMSEADVIRMMYNYVAEGKSLISLADYLNSLNIPTHYNSHNHTGKRIKSTVGVWRPARVGFIIKNTVYKGIHCYGKRSPNAKREKIYREVPAIVSEELWQKAQDVVCSNLLSASRNARYDYILRSLIECENCGHHYRGTSAKKDSRYYICNGRASYRAYGQTKCIGKILNMDWLDDVVWQHCLRFVNSPEILLKEIEREQQENQSNLDALEKEKQNTLLSIAAKDQERQNLISLYRKNLISLSEVEKQLTALEKEKSTLQERAKEIEQQFKDADNTFVKKESVEYILSTLREMLTEGEPSLEVKKTVIQCLVEKILVKTEIDENGDENVSIRIKFRMSKFALPTAWSTLQDVSQTFCFTVNIEYSDAERYRCSHDLNTPATRLKWARLNAKLSHQQLADMTGVTVAVISNTENGKSVPRVNISAKLSKALGQPVWYVGCYDLLPQNTFQEKMTKARCLRGMTKEEASKIIGVNVRTIYTWETEQYEPLPSSARAIEDFLGIL